MHYGHYWGMHWIWWILWLIFIIAFVLYILSPRGRTLFFYESPMEILKRRYANGEIDTDEYEKRKKILERDSP